MEHNHLDILNRMVASFCELSLFSAGNTDFFTVLNARVTLHHHLAAFLAYMRVEVMWTSG